MNQTEKLACETRGLQMALAGGRDEPTLIAAPNSGRPEIQAAIQE